MPLAPYALLRASINGGAVTTGGITVPPSATVQLSADPSASVGAQTYKYEIYGYPIGFSVPSGWTADSSGVYFYSAGATPPIFTLPTIANWGKFMLRLTLNGGISTNTKVIPPAQLVDEKTALSMLSQNGLADVGNLELNQFNANWTPPVQAGLRAIDTAVTAVAGANQKPPAKLLGASNIASLSGEQTIDGVLTSASRVLLIAQTTSSQNGLWLTGAGAWTRPTDFAADAQVIVGQTIFVTSGSINAGTNWQLTSGSTIAGAKTYAQLVGGGSGSTALQPVDAVATTNNALSGTTAIDGVTLTANTSRVLAAAQTTASQNGPWLVQSGAWTRPTDFTVDAQVIAGQSVFVKSGTLGAGTSWQMTAGSTIAGSKTFAKLSLVKHDPVRAVQTAALPAYTYSVGVITATANGALVATAFDGVGPATSPALLVGDRVLVVQEGTKNGIYIVTQLGDGSHPYILTRATDLDSSSDFGLGVQVDILDGLTSGSNYKGTRWTMTTLGTITLDTTSTVWAQMRPKGALEIDLSLPPYNVRDCKPNAQGWDGTNYFKAINQALWDFRGLPAVLKLPTANGGCVPGITPIDHWGGCRLVGGGENISELYPRYSGGFTIIGQTLGFSQSVDCCPQTKAGAVETSTTAYVYNLGGVVATTPTPLSTWRAAFDPAPGGGNPAGANNFFWNLDHAGLLIDGTWPKFQLDLMFSFEDFSLAATSHLISCRGAMTNQDPRTDAFSILLNESTGILTGKLRLTDVTKGAYSAATHVGTGAGTVAGTTTVTATSGSPTITLSGQTITRSTGSWITDGYKYADTIQISGSTHATSNGLWILAAVSATVLTISTSVFPVETLVAANINGHPQPTEDAPSFIVKIVNGGKAGNVGTGAIAGTPTLTFASAGETITRSGGSWITDGYAVGDIVVVAGAVNAANNGQKIITTLTATVMTCAAASFVNETLGTVTLLSDQPQNAVMTGSPTLTFAASGETITRSGGGGTGSWLADGFSAGSHITNGGCANAGNNVSLATITSITDLVLTVAGATFVNETIATGRVNGVPLSYAYAVDGHRYSNALTLAGATTVNVPYEINEFNQPFAAKLDFTGQHVAGDTYAIACTGVNTTVSQSSAQVVTADLTKNWLITLMHDGTTVRFGVSLVGAARDTSASMATGVAATGRVKRRFYEMTALGRPMNASSPEVIQDFNESRGWIGAVRFLKDFDNTSTTDHTSLSGAAVPQSPTPAVLKSYATAGGGANMAGQQWCWRPNSAGTLYTPDGLLRRHWECEVNRTGLDGLEGYLTPRVGGGGLGMANGGVEGIRFNLVLAMNGILHVSWQARVFDHIKYQQGNYGQWGMGPDFGSVDDNLTIATDFGFGFRFFQGNVNVPTGWFVSGNSDCYVCLSTCSIQAPGTLFLNGQIAGINASGTKIEMLLDQMETSYIGNLSIDNENQVNTQCGREMIRTCVLTGHTLELGGSVFGCNANSFLTSCNEPLAGQGGVISLRKLNVIQSKGQAIFTTYPPISIRSATANPVVYDEDTVRFVGGSGDLSIALADRVNLLRTTKGRLGPALIADTGPVPVWAPGRAAKVAAGTLTANRVFPIPIKGAQLGSELDILVEVQSFSVQFTNGGPAGGNVTPVLASGSEYRIRARLNESFNWERV